MSNMEHSLNEIQKAFKSLTYDTELPLRLRDQLRAVRQKKIEKRINRHYGYDIVNGKLVVNEEERAIIRWNVKQFLSYSENPPVELLKRVIKDRGSRERIEAISHEEAKSLVSTTQISKYIAHEFCLKEIYYLTIIETDPSVKFEDILNLNMEELPQTQIQELREKMNSPEYMIKESECYRRINRIFGNPLYIGMVHPISTAIYVRRKRLTNDCFTIENNHEAIITPEQYNEIQKMMQARREIKSHPTE